MFNCKISTTESSNEIAERRKWPTYNRRQPRCGWRIPLPGNVPVKMKCQHCDAYIYEKHANHSSMSMNRDGAVSEMEHAQSSYFGENQSEYRPLRLCCSRPSPCSSQNCTRAAFQSMVKKTNITIHGSGENENNGKLSAYSTPHTPSQNLLVNFSKFDWFSSSSPTITFVPASVMVVVFLPFCF